MKVDLMNSYQLYFQLKLVLSQEWYVHDDNYLQWKTVADVVCSMWRTLPQ